MPVIDIHTHHPYPSPEALINLPAADGIVRPGQWYSAGIHPWTTLEAPTEELLSRLDTLAADPAVKAIGECGYDAVKGGLAFRQLQLFQRQIELSENLGKPLIIHDVKAHDIIIGCRRDLRVRQKWAVHGFRGKPQAAQMLLKAGIWISFGEKFNPATVAYMAAEAPERILAETDESSLSIQQIIEALSEAAQIPLETCLRENADEFLV